MEGKKCTICGRKAVYTYFGVLACSACKIFFRRNAPKGLEKLQCHWDKHCRINENNVHLCSYCRLKKCFQAGMQVDLIRASLTKRTKPEKNPLFSPLPTLNLLQSDNSMLTIAQWNEISNLIHCYDEYIGFRKTENYIREQYHLPTMLCFSSQSFISYCQALFQDVELVYLKNKDFLSLPYDDRSLLLNNTLQHVTSLSANFIANKTGLTKCPAYYNTVAAVSNPMMVPIIRSIQKQLDFDVTIMKIFLGIYCFSTVNYTYYSNLPPVNLSNPKRVLAIQNKYVELAWKYLSYRLGFKDTVKTFTYILRYLFSINETIVQAKDLFWFNNTMESIAEQIELTFISG